ncbi:hypothetical protein DPMN_149297 [Dreissena polymorpha]|uniref:Uncharacterized protein n=1 Tax=Dreissena polymorpha TaxID=45954 RepID=A0A9D4J4U3_DREPO|nr:hypothetical protein DPMN_149297 [Dreissena polymorpha]
MLWFSRRKMELEMLALEKMKIFAQRSLENEWLPESDTIRQDILRRKREVMMEVELRMNEEGFAFRDLIDIQHRIFL